MLLHVCVGLTVIGTYLLLLLLLSSCPLLFNSHSPSPQVSGREEARRLCRAGPRAVDEQCLHHAVHVSRARGDSTRQGEGGGSGPSVADAGLLRGDPAVWGDAVAECARVGGDHGLGVHEAEDGGRGHLMQLDGSWKHHVIMYFLQCNAIYMTKTKVLVYSLKSYLPRLIC